MDDVLPPPAAKPEPFTAPSPAALMVSEDVSAWSKAILEKLNYGVGKNAIAASDHDWFVATALAVRDRIVERWIVSTTETYKQERKRVYYLSLEFLIGRLLFDALTNLGMTDLTRDALRTLGVDLAKLRRVEPDAALGNGGLGRLAACFMESMATLSIAAYGYGIRYENGLFHQAITDGWQREFPETWLMDGNPWEFPRPEVAYEIGFGGRVSAHTDDQGELRHSWEPGERVQAVAYDTPVTGWRGKHVNTLRLWSARSVDPLCLDAFNQGDYVGAMADSMRAQSISKVLYPSDETPAGQELRLRQEYFFASASLQDLLGRHMRQYGEFYSLPKKVAIQLNDTHPAIAVAEMMRLLVDLHQIPWNDAWRITTGVFSYTNHTLLPEALETWPVPLMERMLPRQMQIIYLINAEHLLRVQAAGTPENQWSGLSLIDENSGRRVRMGHLAFVGSHHVNGVSALHTDLMRSTVFHDFNQLFPGRIVNKTNGITFRRWLFEANQPLTSLLVDVLGERVMDDPMALEGLASHVGDAGLRDRFSLAKRSAKVALAKLVRERLNIKLNPDALFDVQIKRIHEYKRQLLNILETIALYDAIRAQPTGNWIPRVKIFAGKAAASYHNAKLIIKLANDVARMINSDPTVRGLLKVVFLPNYNVSLAEMIIPAADLSEQISTAGMEASGTGNMKLALNGALTIGTLDGANVEIKEHVGDENIFIFGLTAQEVVARRQQGISGEATIQGSPMLRDVIRAIESGVFSPSDPGRFRSLVDILTHNDFFLVTADFVDYEATQRKVDTLWRDRNAWVKASMINTAKMGWFSSDRAIGEYAAEIWRATPVSSG
jgi:starch phosphorylase